MKALLSGLERCERLHANGCHPKKEMVDVETKMIELGRMEEQSRPGTLSLVEIRSGIERLFPPFAQVGVTEQHSKLAAEFASTIGTNIEFFKELAPQAWTIRGLQVHFGEVEELSVALGAVFRDTGFLDGHKSQAAAR